MDLRYFDFCAIFFAVFIDSHVVRFIDSHFERFIDSHFDFLW